MARIGEGRRTNHHFGLFHQLMSWSHRMRTENGGRQRRLSQLAANTTNPLRAGWNNLSSARMPKVPKRAERQIRRFGPLLLMLSLIVYLLLGAAAFLFFEHTNHEHLVRKWYFNLIVNRHKFARQIASKIFNGTRNMLVIVDYDSSERIQRDLVFLLNEYERHLELQIPDPKEWTLENSFTYCWGLLITIGHGHRAPRTIGGQVFALFYCLLGVPFFLITMIVFSYRLFELCRTIFYLIIKKQLKQIILTNQRLMLLLFISFMYCSWLLIFTLLLFTFAIPESFWRSLYTAVLASFTIQSADYNALHEFYKLLTLGGATISLMLFFICIFSLTGVWRQSRKTTTRAQRDEGTNKKEQQKGSSATEIANDDGQRQQQQQQTSTSKEIQITKFQVIVDEVGATKLTNSSTTIGATSINGDD